MYGKISVILYFTGLHDTKKNYKWVLEKIGQRGFFEKWVEKNIYAKNAFKNQFSRKFRGSWSQNWNIWTSFCTFLKELLTKSENFRRLNSKIHAGQNVSIYKTEPFWHMKLLGTQCWQICRLNVGGGLSTRVILLTFYSPEFSKDSLLKAKHLHHNFVCF